MGNRRFVPTDRIIERTHCEITARISKLVVLALQEAIAPLYTKQAEEEAHLLAKFKATTDVGWEFLFCERPDISNLLVVMPQQCTAFNVPHPPVKNPPVREARLDYLDVRAEWILRYNTTEALVSEEIDNTTAMYTAVSTELSQWLDQFGEKDPAALSKICAISPSFRACLQNEKDWKLLPQEIKLYKHAPRFHDDFKPMSQELALALRTAAMLPSSQASSQDK